MSQIGAVKFGGFTEDYEARRRLIKRLEAEGNNPDYRPGEVADAVKRLKEVQVDKAKQQLDVTG